MAKGKAAISVAMSDAGRRLARMKRSRDDPPPDQPRGPNKDVKAGQWTPNELGLPSEDPCPVQCLGVEGDIHHFIDSVGQHRALTKDKLNGAGLQDLFALTPHWPMWAYPHYKKISETKSIIDNFEEKVLRRALFQANARRGLFSPQDNIRGRGAWALPGGQLIYHSGDALWLYESGRFTEMETGLWQGKLYPRMPAIPEPWTGPIDPADDPVRTLVTGFRRWNWTRPAVDPVLMLGWIGVAFLGGALKWRSAVFLVGDRETGKSTLQDVLKELFGATLFHAADTTAAGISQPLGHDTRPVALDELEAEADNRKTMEVVKLARAASSGAFKRRGGAGGEHVEYQMRSAFLFSAINTPPLMPQDLSRLALLRLHKLPEAERTGHPLPIDADTCGRMVLAKLMREWHRFPATLEAYRGALAKGGHGGRGQDTYGTLLACADLLLGPELAEELGIAMADDDDLAFWTRELAAAALPEVEDAAPNWYACITHLLTVHVDWWRGGHRMSVAQAIDDCENGNGDYSVAQLRRDLATCGLGICVDGEVTPRGEGLVLAVPNQHPAVSKLFKDTPWGGALGAGVWKEAMRQAPKDVVISDPAVNRVRIAGKQERCSLIVLKRFHETRGR